MARVTVEDCVDKVPNRFELVMLAAHRARSLASGAPLTDYKRGAGPHTSFLLLHQVEAINRREDYQYRFVLVGAAGAVGVVEVGDAVPGAVVEDGAGAEAVPPGRLATLTPLAL